MKDKFTAKYSEGLVIAFSSVFIWKRFASNEIKLFLCRVASSRVSVCERERERERASSANLVTIIVSESNYVGY